MTNPLKFFYICYILLVITPIVNGDSFVWKPVRSMKDKERYMDGRVPCEDDNVLIETGDDPTVLFLDDDLKVSSIYFQDNGVLYFGAKASIGEKKGGWQCEKNYGVEDAIIMKQRAPAFFDFHNWRQVDYMARGVDHPKIHAESVPSSDDTAIFNYRKPSPITVGSQVQLRQLYYGGRVGYINYVTLEQTHFIIANT